MGRRRALGLTQRRRFSLQQRGRVQIQQYERRHQRGARTADTRGRGRAWMDMDGWAVLKVTRCTARRAATSGDIARGGSSGNLRHWQQSEHPMPSAMMDKVDQFNTTCTLHTSPTPLSPWLSRSPLPSSPPSPPSSSPRTSRAVVRKPRQAVRAVCATRLAHRISLSRAPTCLPKSRADPIFVGLTPRRTPPRRRRRRSPPRRPRPRPRSRRLSRRLRRPRRTTTRTPRT